MLLRIYYLYEKSGKKDRVEKYCQIPETVSVAFLIPSSRHNRQRDCDLCEESTNEITPHTIAKQFNHHSIYSCMADD